VADRRRSPEGESSVYEIERQEATQLLPGFPEAGPAATDVTQLRHRARGARPSKSDNAGMRTPLLAALAITVAGPLGAQSTRYRDQVFNNVDRQLDIAYGSSVNRYTNQTEILRLDLYTPRGDTAAKRPAIVVVHGGGFVGGDKATGSFRRQCDDFARRGFVAISINYRLRPRTSPIVRQNAIDAAHDMKAAVRWLRKNATQLALDTTRIGCIGSSAGAITCCEAAYVPGEGNSGNPGYSSAVQAVVDLWGFLWDLNELQRGEAPVQIIHGTADQTVPYSNATALKARADAVGVPAELHPIQNAGHAPWSAYFANCHVAHVVPFFYERLALGQLSGLSARPGWKSPGQITLDTFGIAKDLAVLLVAAGSIDLPVPPLGRLCLDPGTTFVIGVAPLPATPRLPTRGFTASVPAGLKGTVYWQALHVAGVTPRLLINCIATQF